MYRERWLGSTRKGPLDFLLSVRAGGRRRRRTRSQPGRSRVRWRLVDREGRWAVAGRKEAYEEEGREGGRGVIAGKIMNSISNTRDILTPQEGWKAGNQQMLLAGYVLLYGDKREKDRKPQQGMSTWAEVYMSIRIFRAIVRRSSDVVVEKYDAPLEW